MRICGLVLLGLCLCIPAVSRAGEKAFTETNCGKIIPGSDSYWILLEAPDGTKKRLTFGGVLLFKSTSLKYLKWVADLSKIESFEYRADGQGDGLLSMILRLKNERHEFGMISEDCWNGLREHLKDRVPTIEKTSVAKKSVSHKSETIYFGGFAGYDIPLNLVERLSRSEALSRPAYFIGYYDDGGKLYRVEKYFREERSFRHDYSYQANGEIKESKTVNADGKVSVLLFDGSGDPIEPGNNKTNGPSQPKTER